MIEEAITYHLVTIEMLLAAMIFNLTVSQLVKEPFAKIIRSGYFLFLGDGFHGDICRHHSLFDYCIFFRCAGICNGAWHRFYRYHRV